MGKKDIREGLQFTVLADFTVFKIKKIIDSDVTVSWMEGGVERFINYSLSQVSLHFATKTWEPLPPKQPF